MTPRERKRIADQIRTAIESSPLSAYEIARLSGVDKAALSRFANGKAGLSLESIEKLASVLDLQIVVKKK